MKYLGELAALATALCWSFGSIFFTISSRAVGSNVVNRLRIVFALVLLTITHTIFYGQILPWSATLQQWFWFALSGVIGFTIGDSLLFKSFVLVGPRLGMLMMALAPVIGSILAWIFLNEYLTITRIIAIMIALFGVGLVVTEPRGKEESAKSRRVTGILIGFGAALGQALGLFASKKGLIAGLTPLSGNLIRLIAATVTMWLAAGVFGRIPATFQRLRNRRVFLFILAGSILGPFIGVGFSLIAIQYSYIGVASTIMALPPVFLIPLSRLVFKEHISVRAIVGTLIALSGVALLFLF